MINFTAIPQDVNGSVELRAQNQLLRILEELIPGMYISTPVGAKVNSAFTRWFSILSYILSTVQQSSKSPISIFYFQGNFDYSEGVYEDFGCKEHHHTGLFICQDTSANYDPNKLNTAGKWVELEAAEKVLKQDSNHFLKIHKYEDSPSLIVYTNKDLKYNTIHKLLRLFMALDEDKWKDTFPEKLIDACAENDIEAFNKLINEFWDSDEVKAIRFKEFENLFKNSHGVEIEKLENRVKNTRSEITQYQNHICTLAKELRDTNEKIMMLKNLNYKEDVTPIYKYLDKHPYIKSFEISGSGLNFTYIAPLLYFSEAPAEKYLQVDYMSDFKKNIIRLIIERKFELYTICKIHFDISTFTVDAKSVETSDYFKHPHIDRFGCFGNHTTAIAEAAETGNFLGAIEQISQAVLNLNFYDGCVIDAMAEDLRIQSELKTWLDKETGELLTTREAMERSGYEYEEIESDD